MRRFVTLFVIAALTVSGGAAWATARNESDFVVRLRGITVGAFHLSARQDGTGYSAAARIEDAGLLSVVRSFSYRGTSRGTLRDGRLAPAHYEEVADTGRRQSQAVLDYGGGVPRVTKYVSSNPPGPDAPDPATQGGTIDPTTTLFAVFRDLPESEVCNSTILMYDGMRRSRLVLLEPRREGETLRCRGEYSRVQGFTAKELSRHTAFPLQVIYGPNGNGQMHVTRVEVTSVYGLATLDRR